MRIECPTCSTGFNVDDSQIGTKGRCPKCGAKFIIPASADDEIEVLEEGDAGAAKDEEKEKVKEKAERPAEKRDREDDEPKSEKPEKKEREKKKRPERSRDADEDEDELLDTSGVGKALGLLALGLVLGLVIGFALGRLTAAEGDPDPAEGGKKDPFGLSEAN